jgi:predicted DNA-binding protein (UPF0251 family)
MPRPTSTRRILEGLTGRMYKPRGVPMDRLESVGVTLDGLEALRLADLEGLYQEEAARRMNVSRPTFARILAQARRAVAEALVLGKALEFSGGEVEHRPRRRRPCPVHGGRRRGRGCRCRRGGAPSGEATRKEQGDAWTGSERA